MPVNEFEEREGSCADQLYFRFSSACPKLVSTFGPCRSLPACAKSVQYNPPLTVTVLTVNIFTTVQCAPESPQTSCRKHRPPTLTRLRRMTLTTRQERSRRAEDQPVRKIPPPCGAVRSGYLTLHLMQTPLSD